MGLCLYLSNPSLALSASIGLLECGRAAAAYMDVSAGSGQQILEIERRWTRAGMHRGISWRTFGGGLGSSAELDLGIL